MSRKKYLVQCLQATEKSEFDSIIKTYLKEIHSFSRIAITDGKDDIGIDIKVFDLAGQDIQYQLTTQKSETTSQKSKFKSKLEEDIAKAAINTTEYGYSNSLFFFYSQSLTNKVIREYEKLALDSKINLTIIEATRIAEESLDYLTLQKSIVDTNNIQDIINNDKVFPKGENSLLFDLISFGKASDFKLQIIESFLLEQLYNKSELTIDEIKQLCSDAFKSGEKDAFYNNLLSRLQTKKAIGLNSDRTKYILTATEYEKVKNLKEQQEIDESIFIAGLHKILEKYGCSSCVSECATLLKQIYLDNFESITEAIYNLSSNGINSISRTFQQFLEKQVSEPADVKSIGTQLLEFCQSNTYIQKYAATKVFSESINLNQIQQYINQKKKVYIDTQISIYALCYFYNPKKDYNNFFFKATRSLIELARNNKLKLYLSDRYLWETRNHLVEAFNLIPFTQIPNFRSFGASRNAFFNYYLNIVSEDDGLSFEEFLGEFGFKIADHYKLHNKIIKGHLEKLGFVTEEIPTDYDIDRTVKSFNWELDKLNKFKPKFALNNDAIMFEFLCDNDVERHPLQPIFLTWDKIFSTIQTLRYTEDPEAQRWFLKSPWAFINQYSLTQFKVDSETISDEMIALLNHDIVVGTTSFLDNMNLILNPSNEVGLEITKKIAAIRDSEIHRITKQEIVPPEDIKGEAVIDDVFYKLTRYYVKTSESNLEEFKKLFTQQDKIEEVVNILLAAVKEVYETKRLSDIIYESFDKLIKSEQK